MSQPARAPGGLTALVAACVATALVPEVAWARPQFAGGLLAGGGAQITDAGQEGFFYGGLRGDVMLGREGPRDWGAGPYLELGTRDFETLEPGGGMSLLVPIHPALPIVVSLGAFWSFRPGHNRGGWSATLAWGSRSYNYHADYGISATLFVTARAVFPDSDVEVLGGVSLDLAVLALPFVILWTWLTHGDPDEP